MAIAPPLAPIPEAEGSSSRILPSLELVAVSVVVPSDKGSDAALANNRGVKLLGLGDAKGAMEAYNEAISLNPELSAAFNNRANLFLRLNQIDDALQSYGQAIRLDPKIAIYRYNFGSALLDKGDFAGAVDQLQIATSSGPQHSNAYLNLGLAYSGLKQFSEALDAYDQSIKLDPTNLSALAGRAIALSELEDWHKAVEAYEVLEGALQHLDRAHDAAYIQIYLQHAQALVRLGKWQEAQAIVETWRIGAEAEAGPYYAMGLIADHFGQLDDAVIQYSNAIRREPENYDALTHLGTDLVRLGRPSEAQEPLKKAIRVEPTKASAFFHLGLAQKHLGEFSDAASNFRSAIEKGMDAEDVYAELGYALYQSGNYVESASAYVNAEKRNASDPDIPANLGFIYAIIGEPNDAIAAFHRALALNSPRVTVREGLIKSLVDVQNYAAAANALHEIQAIQGVSNPKENSIDTVSLEKHASSAAFSPGRSGDTAKPNRRTIMSAADFINPVRLAEQLFGDAQDHAAPINVSAIAIASKISITIVEFSDGNKTASRLLRLSDGRYQIQLASELRVPWKRIFLARQLYVALADDSVIAPNERVPAASAETFAHHLLMPSSLVERYWPTLRNPEAMSAVFDVPQSVMEKRLTELGINWESRHDEYGPQTDKPASAGRRNFGALVRGLAPQ